jgi:FMN-dependent NADH-azoreductase
MPKLLVIEVSPRGAHSASRTLSADFVTAWKAARPEGEVIVRDLEQTRLPYIDLVWIGGAFSPPGRRSEEMISALAIGDELIAELKAVDHIVVATPMYNFSIPAILKAYIDHVCRVGETFTMAYEGLVTGKKATVILASGGDFSPGTPYEAANVAASYLRQVLGFIGIKDVEVILAGSTLALMTGETSVDAFRDKLRPALEAAAGKAA